MIKKVLVLHGKYGLEIFDASTPDKEIRAYIKVFTVNDDNEFYDEDYMTDHELRWYKEITSGDYRHLRDFINLRSNYEYEKIEMFEVQ